MKKILLIIIAFAFPVVFFSGCESFLDRQPDEAMTEEAIFRKYQTTLDYLINVYSYLPDESNPSGQVHAIAGASDEACLAFTGRPYTQINRDTWTPASNLDRAKTYDDMYKGIREATYFMQHVFDCPESELTRDDARQWYAEARFMRAYYYFRMMQVYGPVFLLGDEPVDFNSDALKYRERDTWEDCVEYVVTELEECQEWLPYTQPKQWYGRATKGAAMAVKARLLLYSARPLFNGNDLYKNVKTPEGVNLFPTVPDPEKWKLAADAAQDIIELNMYELIGEFDGTPHKSLKEVFTKRCNNELVWSSESYARPWKVVCTPPTDFNGYGGVSTTQFLVDAFAMDNGRYPITGYTETNTTQVPIIDPASGYNENGFSSFKHPILNVTLNTYNMYVNREPRFYTNVFWSGLTWKGGTSSLSVEFYSNGNCGPITSHNYAPCGYYAYKFIDPEFDSKSGGSTSTTSWGYMSWPLFRYAEVLLNYAEAMNEYDPGDPLIVTYLNRVRTRAGVPPIEDVYPDAIGDPDKMRELIRRERLVELCFENHRYFDTRTWMIAEKTNNGPVWGMNIYATEHTPTGEFWKRTPTNGDGGVAGPRKFSKRCYLYPMPQMEVDRVNFTQNYGW